MRFSVQHESITVYAYIAIWCAIYNKIADANLCLNGCPHCVIYSGHKIASAIYWRKKIKNVLTGNWTQNCFFLRFACKSHTNQICKQPQTRLVQRLNQQRQGAEHIVIRNNAARSHSVIGLIRALSATLAAAERNSAVPTSRLIAPSLRTIQF
jgi:hypothetical protein